MKKKARMRYFGHLFDDFMIHNAKTTLSHKMNEKILKCLFQIKENKSL